ncbi:MAG: UDP-N-acetylglucosamine 2-epimerase (hydrolyzing) [Candidatus Rokubacteria bacterium]|nr:UDP-N-acetylglucosamine 2-epimerase (hydrolyzing) [Candidatus Rokubacteria bacterium]
MSDKRRILYLSGKRGGFGAMLPTLLRIEAHPALELATVVTDMHLYEAFGATVSEVEQWVKVAYRVDMEQRDDSRAGRATAIGTAVRKMVDVVADARPDLALVIGDRGEALAMTIAALNLDVPVAHVQGGDVSGNIDELFRHAITKMSHLHLVASPSSAARVRGLGEEPWRIFEVGDPHVDLLVQKAYTPEAVVRERYRVPPEGGLVVVLQHAVTGEVDASGEQMRATLGAVCPLGRRTIVVYPCSDPGYEGIIRAIREAQAHPFVSVHRNIPHHDFLGLLAVADVMVDNSSSGLIEAPYVPLAAVNVGTRQEGRLRAENVLDVPYERDAIAAALDRALHDRAFRARVAGCRQPFGDGRTCERITDVLAAVPLGPRLLHKRMTY